MSFKLHLRLYIIKGFVLLPSSFNKNTKSSSPNNLAKISNSLVECFVRKNNLTALKILFYISSISLQTPIKTELVSLRFKIKDILDYTNMDSKTFKRNLISMQETVLTFVTNDREGFARYEENICIIPYSKIDYNGYIDLKIFSKIHDLIYDVKSKFTVIDLDNLMKLTSKHSVRMIQLLEYIEGFSSSVAKRKTYSLSDFNLMFGTNYKNFYELERKILLPVQTELNEFSSLTFLFSFNYDKENKASSGRPKAVSITIDLKTNRQRQLKLF